MHMREGWVWGWYLSKLTLMGEDVEDVERCEGCMILSLVKMC